MSTTTEAQPRDARADYQVKLEVIETDVANLNRIDARFSHIRLGLFGGLVLAVGFSATTRHPIWVATAVICLISFLVVVVWNESYRQRLIDLRNQAKTLRRLLDRLDRNWPSLGSDRLGKASAEIALSPRQAALSGDLDLMGESSLFQLVSMAGTHPGMTTLASWLCDPADVVTSRQRHAVAKQLATQRESRLRFHTLARDVGASTGNPDAFVGWSREPNWLEGRRWLVTWSSVSGWVAIAMLAAVVVGSLTTSFESAVWMLLYSLIGLAVFNLILAAVVLAPAARIFTVAMASRRQVSELAELFGAVRQLPMDDGMPDASDDRVGLVQRWRSCLLEGPRSAMTGMNALSGIAKAGSLKQSAGTFFIYLPLQALGLWDVRVLRRLEAWKDEFGADVAGWFESLGELEAIFSVGTFCDEQSDWASPEWAEESDSPEIRAMELGHPLLGDDVRVRNDVVIGPQGTLLLVTGSNMSGKSTMLRSVGLNVALATAGGPVCAKSMRLPALEMSTSVRVSDDLSEGVSYYMAELNRLADVVQHAQSLARDRESGGTDRTMLFLLDEILQGTNSRERLIAVARVLRHLVQFGAIGAITTHDLELANDADLVTMATTVHFRETITPDASGNDRMTFDYKMREGVSPTTNALRLLEMVGLQEDAVTHPAGSEGAGNQTSP
ncbi:MAG: MutS family DNA mismatch repair protein [Planctomycetota bacterium]